MEVWEAITKGKIFNDGAGRLHSMQVIATEWLAGGTHLHNTLVAAWVMN